MTQEEVIKLAKEAGFGNYAYEAAGIFERFAAMVAAAEREKCTGTQEFVTLPREVVELAIEAIGDAKHKIEFDAIDALISALKQPPTTEQSSAVQQPQGEQEPFAWISPRALEWGTRQSEKVVKLTCKAQPEYDFTEPLYTHPQPKREPLTDAQAKALLAELTGRDQARANDYDWGYELQIIRAIEAAHNIK